MPAAVGPAVKPVTCWRVDVSALLRCARDSNVIKKLSDRILASFSLQLEF